MKIYLIQLFNKSQLFDFIRFSKTYNIPIYVTYSEEAFLDTSYLVTCTDEQDSKITSEEKAKLISEKYAKQIKKTENL